MNQKSPLSLTINRDLRDRLEAERRTLSEHIGANLSMNQAAQMLLRRALDQKNDFQTAPAG